MSRTQVNSALPGGQPRAAGRRTFLPFHVPSITEVEVNEVVAALCSGWLTTGPRVKEFEAEFARTVGARNALAVSSCTAGLHLALEAIGLRPGDEVLVPTMTFAATAEVVRYFDATPVLVDCEPEHLTMDPDDLERRVTPLAKAVIPVHYAGQPCDMERILDVARAYALYVIDDAAHSFPAAYRGHSIGTVADVTCFSFYATKSITTGEGGMITTENDALARRMRLMCLHGIDRDAWRREGAADPWYYEIRAAGYKYNLSDLAAALGLAQLRRCRELHDARLRIVQWYQEGLRDLPLRLPVSRAEVDHAWHLFVVQLELERLSIDRSRFIQLLRDRNIGASVHFMPLHLHPYYREVYPSGGGTLPVASAAYERLVSLPLFPGMSQDDAEDVVRAVREILQSHTRD